MNKILLLLSTALLLVACMPSPNAGNGKNTDTLQFFPLDTLQSGKAISLPLPFDNDYVVKVENAYGATFLDAQNLEKEGAFHIPGKYTEKQGRMKITLLKENQPLYAFPYYIVPLKQVHSLENYFGQKFIPLDIPHSPEIITILLDSLDNSIVNTDPIYYTSIQNQNRIENRVSTSQRLHVFPIEYAPITGKRSVTLFYQNLHSEEQYYYIYAGQATPFSIQSKIPHPLADGNSLFRIETDEIKDSYGNTISDGTQVYFEISLSNGNSFQMQSSTLFGKAQVDIVHPHQSQTYQIHAYVLPTGNSNTLSLRFENALNYIPYQQKGHQLKIGPLFTLNKSFVAFGTPVTLTLYNAVKHKLQGFTTSIQEGEALIEIPSHYTGQYFITLHCLGYSTPYYAIEL